MELHAWINPYRAKTKGTKELATTHPYFKHPDRYFEYAGQLIMDPGIPENRDYICHVVTDILLRYDVDGIHIDELFLPLSGKSDCLSPMSGRMPRYGHGSRVATGAGKM